MDDPNFGEFCRELSEFYVNDEVKPGLHISFLNYAETGSGIPDVWYIAVHRYPNGPLHEHPMQRMVVCSTTRTSFGLALFELKRFWMIVRDLNADEEVINWTTYRNTH